ncbi:AMP-binding protein [Glycomyces sp. YM15]|uniref:AMP-binding protein n=1 Tax=Glycomyces sp. YM15 TaxID=2800446 RepID=UPI001963A89A|nr:AMP-binding protein [Glycomyces sp. YM15]
MTVATPMSIEDTSVQYRRRGWWRETTFLDDLRRQAIERPRKTAIAGRRLDGARTDLLDYADLERLADRFADGLIELGVRPGDVVAAQLPNRWEAVPLMFACMAVGAILCPIAPECEGEDLRHRLALTEARLCVTVAAWRGRPLAAQMCALRDELPLERIVVIDGPLPQGGIDFHRHFTGRTGARTDRDATALGPDDPFVVLFTSGTTGLPKGVVHSQNTVYAGIRGYADALMLDDGLVAAVTNPLVHYSGFAQGILTGVMLGGTVLFQDGADPAGMLGLIERHRATLLYGPPPTHTAIAAAQRSTPHDTTSLRHSVVGASPVVPELEAELRTTFGTRTASLWGMSEFGPITVSRPCYDPDWAAHSHGRPIDAMELRIDGDAATGRLRVRGASRALGYFGNQDAFDAQIDGDGWFDTGDVARVDGRGGIRILGRAGDAIVRDGEVAPVAELEALAARHPHVAEAALVGAPGTASILLAAVPRDGVAPELASVRAHLTERGADPRFLPDRLEVLAALPKTLTGKVRKTALRKCYLTLQETP